MIREATGDELMHIRSDDVYITRIRSLYLCYGTIGAAFAGFWVQERRGKVVAAISRFEDKFTLWLSHRADVDEIASFLWFGGSNAFLSSSKYNIVIPIINAVEGDVLSFCDGGRSDDISIKELYTPSVKEEYELLKRCEGEGFTVPDYMMFLSDVTHRTNCGRCMVKGLRHNGMLASSAMTVAESLDAVILGAVATHPDYRRRGLSRRVVRSMALHFQQQGKSVYVLSVKAENTKFYLNAGFAITDGFREIFTGESTDDEFI